MCTLIAAVRQFECFPLVVAANRDERLDRPASSPRIWKLKTPFLAPRDEAAGGTWLGLNRPGLFVAVTNRFGVPKDNARASRGALVVDALQAGSAAALREKLGGLADKKYNAFHLFYADAKDAFVTWSDGEKIQHQSLEPGLHIVTERSLGGDDHARTELIHDRWKFSALPSADPLASLLRVHREEDPLGSTCVHAPVFNYGTRSSMLLYRADALKDSRIHWAEGSPCKADFAPQPRWIAALAG